MALVSKIDSNITGLRVAEEESLKTLPANPVWNALEPNSYSDFGGQLSTVARNPINAARQRKKGVTTDLDASGGFNSDFTQTNLQDLMQGFFFADFREKGTSRAISAVTTAAYSTASTSKFFDGSIIMAAGFANPENNGLKFVTSVTAGAVGVSATLVAEASPANGSLVVVGFQGEDAEFSVDVSGALPRLVSSLKDLTELGLTPGEYIFIGGDAAGSAFTKEANNGFKRVRAVTATDITFDKSDLPMEAEDGTGVELQLFLGRMLKNELGTLIKRRTYQLERTLGSPDTAQPTQVQSEYLVGAVANEFTLNVPTADKVNADLAFVALDYETRSGAVGVKSGTRPTLAEADAFNTSSDITKLRMSVVDKDSAVPVPLFNFVTEMTLSINNNASAAKAVGVLGGFDVTVGTFQVSGNVTAYFANVEAIEAVRSNADVTLDVAAVKNNAGWVFDLPLVALGDGRASIEQDQAITLPLSMDAATAAGIDQTLDYTASLCFFDYLPSLADG